MSPLIHKKPFCRNRFRHTETDRNFRRFRNYICTFLCVLTLLSVLCGCANHKPSEHPSHENSGSAEHVTFTAFLDEFFRDYATSDSLSLHYTIHNPETMQIVTPTVSLGHFSKTSLLEANKTAANYLERLHTFSRDSLDEADRLTYDLLEYALKHSGISEEAIYYDTPLGPTTGLQTQLPILLAEYRFTSIEDVEDYFLLLDDLPNYFAELCAFEQARSAAGTQACAEVLSRIILQCNSFVENPGSHFLIESFRERLASVSDLTATQIAELCIRNQKLVFTKVIPSYEQLNETLQGLINTSIPAKGLSAFPEGSSYYESLVHSNTGSDRSMEELEQMLQKALAENMLTMMTLYESDTLREELEEYQKNGLSMKSGTEITPTTPASETTPDTTDFEIETDTSYVATNKNLSVSAYSSAVLQQLQARICNDFPASAKTTFRVQTIHPSLEDFISPALYLVPPLDNYQENVIYINQAKCSTESLYSTLAHEGYPGHLYQNTYFASTSPHPVRMLLNFTGYDEGWGTYAELYSYQYADCSEELRQFLIAEQVAGLCLYSLSDIRIHYHGADLETTVSFLKEYGFSEETAEEVFYIQLAEPAIYLPYSVGYLEICGLRDLYHEIEGADASLLPFHTFLLETGPAPFGILRNLLEQNF